MCCLSYIFADQINRPDFVSRLFGPCCSTVCPFVAFLMLVKMMLNVFCQGNTVGKPVDSLADLLVAMMCIMMVLMFVCAAFVREHYGLHASNRRIQAPQGLRSRLVAIISQLSWLRLALFGPFNNSKKQMESGHCIGLACYSVQPSQLDSTD